MEGFSRETMEASAGLLPFPEVPSEIVRYLGLLLYSFSLGESMAECMSTEQQ